MQNYLSRERLSSPLFYSCLLGGISLYFILSFIFAEKLQANNGLGWDGWRYADLVKNLLDSKELDSYLIMRVIPSIWVHIVFKIFSIDSTPANIISGFEVLNLISILFGTFFTKRIMEHFNIQPMLQVLGLLLLLVNYAVLNFTVYYPVMTDSTGFALGAALLYFYVKAESVNLWLVSLLGFFTWPTIGFLGIILIVFPFHGKAKNEEEKSSKFIGYILPLTVFVYVVAVGFYLIYKSNDFKPMAYTLPLDRTLAPISITVLAFTALWWASWIKNFPVFSVEYIGKKISLHGVASVAFLVVVFLLFKNLKELPASENFNHFILTRPQIILGLVKPFIVLVSHVNYFGAVLILLLVFHQTIQNKISALGLGFVLAIIFNLILFGIVSESRSLINLLPWFVVMLVVSINHLQFSFWMFFPALLLNFISSKIWMKIGNVSNSGFNPDGTIAFPYQKFFMNLGPWISTEMWLLFCIVFTVALLLQFLFLFRIKFTNGKLSAIKIFENLPANESINHTK